MADVLGYLASKNWYPKSVIGDEGRFLCFFHDEPGNKRGRLYINLDTTAEPGGVYFCHKCGAKGNLITLKRHFGDPIEEKEKDSDNHWRVLQAAAEYYVERLGESDRAASYLVSDRGFSAETVRDRRFGWADGGLRANLKQFPMGALRAAGLIYDDGNDYFRDELIIPYIVNGNVVSLRGKKIGGKYRSLPGDQVRLFNSDVCWDKERIFVCEGEFDAVLLEQKGFHAVGVPGAIQWKDSWTDYFRNAKRVYVVYDNDDTGRTGSEKVKAAIGDKAKIVAIPPADPDDPDENDGNDLSDWFVKQGHDDDDFQGLLRTTYEGLLLSVDQAFTEWKDDQVNVKRLFFGFEKMDATIGGFKPGQVVVTLAKPGTGKTMLLLNTFERILRAEPDRKILFVSLEQTRAEWFERARRIHTFYNLYADDQECLDFYRDRLMIVDKNRVTEGEFYTCIEEFEQQLGQPPDLVAVDYLGYFARSFPGERYSQVSDAIMSMKEIAKDKRLVMFVPHQVNRGVDNGEEPDFEASRDSGVVEETADFLFTVWSPDNRKGRSIEERTGEVNMRIAKSRHGGVGTKIDLQFAPLSLVLVPQADPFYTRAKAEQQYYKVKDSWEEAVHRHRTGDKNFVVGGPTNAFKPR